MSNKKEEKKTFSHKKKLLIQGWKKKNERKLFSVQTKFNQEFKISKINDDNSKKEKERKIFKKDMNLYSMNKNCVLAIDFSSGQKKNRFYIFQ